ncbi:Mitogen-activated protein kinase kinase kinase A [Morus notabilis]|uniref:Mitogen-activated protein kinase kinase kinase A n=1 Tax=Morus notabilis TaxID=981085 RepID=W9QQL5_9ROSA|nr:mitogen-activated protein kinase kinase kinase 18 [Morus notabilis]EXB37868.1 Mitogen-activated protein kinase kinase kinase A [Morus notabilis]
MDWNRGQIIGRGSSATVSVATSSISGEIFAVKSAELSQSEALQREQKILSSLNSPHVVSYIGHDVTRENSHLVYNLLIEYVPGGTLNDALRRKKRPDEAAIGRYTRKIVQGLEYLHSLGLVHCDIKGANILMAETGPKIADFGCARWANSGDEERPISGTPTFMAPEAARGEHQGCAGDVWSLGCTIIEMASGNSPWSNSGDPVSVLYRVAYSGETPEFPSFLSEKAEDFLGKCLRRNPEERWTASQLLKHPFLEELSLTEVKESDSSCSPTSILDQGIWNCLEDHTSESFGGTRSGNWAVDRIGKLALFSGEVTWTSGDQSWVTIRSDNDEQNNSSIMDYGMDLTSSSSCSSESDIFGDENIIDINIVGFSQCREKSVVAFRNLIFERDRDDLLVIPLTSTFLKS